MCLTYGRPHLVEEAIASFLRQDYAGVKELIVLNDLPEQPLQFDHPEVKIINVDKRFRGVGEKRNACAALCSHDLLFAWDEDDISLAHLLFGQESGRGPPCLQAGAVLHLERRDLLRPKREHVPFECLLGTKPV
jgi:glycosyl transferase family 2